MNDGKEKPGVLIYFDIRDPLSELDMSQRGQLFTAILDYGADGIDPDWDDKLLRMAWSIVKKSIDRDDANYRTTVVKRKYAIYCRYEKEAGRTPLTFDEWRIHVYTHEDTCIPTTTTTTTPTTTTTTTSNIKESTPPAQPADSPKTKRFVKPTTREVAEYIFQNHYSVDPERFYAYYESCGWQVKGRSMRDWKAAVRYWETSDKKKLTQAPAPQRKGNYFVQQEGRTDYSDWETNGTEIEDVSDEDLEEFERMLRGGGQ